jgi:hypothetical protein
MADVTVSLATSGKDQVLGDLKSVETAGQKMGETFGSIAGKLAGLAAGYVSITATIGAFHGAMEKGGQLADFSDQTGIAVDKLVLLERAFENNGMKAEDLGSVINKMQKAIAAAGVEGSEAADKLGSIGIKVSDLKAMTPDQQFETIAKAIAGIEDPGTRAALTMEVFGKSGGKLLPFFKDFDGAIKQAQGEVGGFAKVMGENAVKFDYLGDGIAAIGRKLMEFAAGALVNIQGGLKEFVDLIKNFDAAGFGQKVTNDIAAPLKAIADSLVDGNFKQALSLATELVTLEAMKMGNEFYKIFTASVAGVGSFIQGVFAPDSYTLNYIQTAFSLVGNFITKALQMGIIGMLDGIPMFSSAVESMKYKLETTNREIAQQQNTLATGWEVAASELGKVSENAMSTAGSVYKMSDGYFDVASQQEKVQTKSEKIVSEHESMVKLTAQIATNGKKYEESLVGVSQSFASFKAKGGEAGSLAGMAGLKMPAMNLDATGLGPVAGPEDRAAAAEADRAARAAAAEADRAARAAARSGTSKRASNDMPDLLKKSDYLERNMYGEWVQSSQDKINQRLETRAIESVSRSLAAPTGSDERASREQTINNLFSKWWNGSIKEGRRISPAELRKAAEAEFDKRVNEKLRDAKGDGPGGGGTGSGPGSANKKSPQEEQSGSLSEILKVLNEINTMKLPVYALS